MTNTNADNICHHQEEQNFVSSLQRVRNAQEKSNSSSLIVLTQAHSTYRREWSGIARRIWNMQRGKYARKQ